MPSLSLASKAIRELGSRKLDLYAIYQLGLRTGHYRRATPNVEYGAADRILAENPQAYHLAPALCLPSPQALLAVIGKSSLEDLLSEANQIAAGQVRLFGGSLVPLVVKPSGELHHWTRWKPASGQDIKYVWEPGRFGWAFTLGRAYYLSGDESYAAIFWECTSSEDLGEKGTLNKRDYPALMKLYTYRN